MSALAKKSLGRGLASLIPDSAFDGDVGAAERIQLRIVPIDEVRPNPLQPRTIFASEDLASLAESVRSHGILQPLVVRKEEGHYVLVAGERRLRAAALAGLSEVPVVVREVGPDGAALELALVENLQRADLDPVSSAKGYQRLVDDYGYTQDEVAQAVGKDRATIANAVRLLKLPAFALDALQDGRLTAGHARALLALGDPEELRRMVGKVVALGLSVRATERLVGSLVRTDPVLQRQRKTAVAKTLEYSTKMLENALGTSVSIKARTKGGGRIVIDYADAEDLDRLVQRLRGGA